MRQHDGLQLRKKNEKAARKSGFFLLKSTFTRASQVRPNTMAKRRKNSRHDVKPWLTEIRPKHVRLTAGVVALLKNLLSTQGIDFLSVDGRTKDETSIIQKCERKSYANPKEQLTDISGIRIVTFLESQVLQITELVRTNFDVDNSNSLDRSDVLGSDRIGYRSSHFVCTLGTSREQLPEYAGLQGLKFELQVRTVLQHAWAELAHDRSFKLGLDLPKKIERRLNLHAGLLEVVDSAFDEIAREIDEYRLSLTNKELAQITEIELDSISLEKYLSATSKRYRFQLRESGVPNDVVTELRNFGVGTIGDLEKIATSNLIAEIKPNLNDTTATGFLRDVMMFTDAERYFANDVTWSVIDLEHARLLSGKYGATVIASYFSRRNIAIAVSEDDHFIYDFSEMINALSN